ncbi:MAG: class I SAM-dependent methyltransferase [Gammaproteobacteria bacterium]|nr:class I SAM-dependent methyltransferase [Gammaproteobacteria bacterium]
MAAGNGAIATIAAEIGQDNRKDFFVAATDLADIHADLIGDEATKRARKTVEFHSRIPCESQPFEADSFELVTSQFGFEYSTIEQTLAEVRRVLVPGGRFVAISHHTRSVLIQAAKVELDIYELALDELDLVAGSRRYFEALGELPDDPQQLKNAQEKVQPLVEEYNRRMHRFQDKYAEHECGKFIIGAIGYIARTARQTTRAERLEALDKAGSDFQLARARLDDMVAASLDNEQIETLTLTAREAGFNSVHCLKLYGDDNGLAGWQIHLS